ncbi:hypothetical protein EJB05_55012, partial [Eragrostis curvula]
MGLLLLRFESVRPDAGQVVMATAGHMSESGDVSSLGKWRITALPITCLFPFMYFMVNTAWGIGLIVGPALGGYLAQPAEKYPHIFSKDSVFGRFPYLLPCLSVSSLSAVVLIICTWLPILSLWAVSDRKYGGLSFSTEDIGEITASTGISLLQNNAVCQEQRGTANGISTTAMSFFKAIAPIGAGAIFSWAQKRQDDAFLPGYTASIAAPCVHHLRGYTMWHWYQQDAVAHPSHLDTSPIWRCPAP